jgi:hypothetical protein
MYSAVRTNSDNGLIRIVALFANTMSALVKGEDQIQVTDPLSGPPLLSLFQKYGALTSSNFEIATKVIHHVDSN